VSEILSLNKSQLEEDRFSRFDLIGWWEQDRLARARVLVIGAGALGNELIKNLALLGVGQIFVADLDTIENSNLSRSILYRAEDCGRSKAEVAAERARQIYPTLRAQAFVGNAVFDLGLGVFRWADVILGGLDNREARVAMNAAAARLGKSWIDGAIERLDGVARVFDPANGACYECTMNDVDWQMLEARRSCALLSREQMEQGKVPTTPTTASVIAGIQVQEAVKMLHGQPSMSGQGFVFDGTYHQSYLVKYSRKDDCPSHDAFQEIETLDWSIFQTQVGTLLERVHGELGSEAVIETNHDMLSSLTCANCNETSPCYTSLGKVTEVMGLCPSCGAPRAPNIYHTLSSQSELLDRTLGELGVPPWEILTGRQGIKQRHYEFAGDRRLVLGPLSE
jgi:molybdopterin/thiamine biosynthesis adenylyltransferase